MNNSVKDTAGSSRSENQDCGVQVSLVELFTRELAPRTTERGLEMLAAAWLVTARRRTFSA